MFKSPNYLENFILFDSEMFSFSGSAQSRPYLLIKFIGIFVVVAEGEVHTTLNVLIAFVWNGEISSATENRPEVWMALDSFFGLYQCKFLFEIQGKQKT